MPDRVIAYVDKTVLRITGVRVKGLNPLALEKAVTDAIGRPVRVIGVTGESIDMDVYGLPDTAVSRDRNGLVKAIAAVEGIRAEDVIAIETSARARDVALADIPTGPPEGCVRELWLQDSEPGRHRPDGR
jgi:hypothetical protein